MLVYLLKSGACLAILLLFYKVVLERESMHHFKRFYLLAALVLSLSIPTIVFTEIIYINTSPTQINLMEDYSLEAYHLPIEESINYTYWTILLLYSIGVCFFFFKFLKNLYYLKQTIKYNPKLRKNSIVKVLLSLQIVPHTFFNYIFLNKQKFEENKIPDAVILHEETHARQKHSIDILLLELLQILFWFNPLIYLYKKAIKLNHEFLADSAVLEKGLEKSDYQSILLAFSSNVKEPLLTNAINYSSIKKRFTVMKKQTSKKVSLVKSLLILPLVAVLLYGFSEKEILELQKDSTPQTHHSIVNDIKRELEHVDAMGLTYTKMKEQVVDLYINKKNEILIDEQIVKLEELAQALKAKFKTKILPNKIRVAANTEESLEAEFMYNLVTELNKAGIKQIKFCTAEYSMPQEDYKDNIEITPETIILKTQTLKLTQTTIKEILININNKGQLLVQDDLVAINELKEYLSKINKHLSFDERKKVIRSIIKVDAKTPKDVIQKTNDILKEYGTATIDIVGPENSIKSSQQKSATREEMKAYNGLAKKYNEMDRNHMQIKMQDVQRLKTIYAKMSTKQREDAEPFPDFPEPPPLPAAPKAPEAPNEREVAAVKIKEIIEEQDPYDVVSGNMRTKQSIMAEPPLPPTYIKDIRLDNPPKPPTPPNPLDHVIKMAKKGASFMYKGKEISSDKAIDLIKNNKELSISTKQSNNGTPVVKISLYL